MLHTSLRSPLGALALAVSLTGCAGNTLGTLGDILGGAGGQGGQTGQLRAEVRGIDTSRQTIQVTTEQGQTGNVRYDQNTVVVYNQQQYAVTALERGDIVVMQVQEDAQGNLYVGRVDVQQSVQERSGQAGTGVQQYTGRVGTIDHDRGAFVLQTQNGNYTVTLPYNAPRATVDYFNRLRTGDTVRLEATSLGTSRVELYRFL